MEGLFSLVLGKRFRIENSFFWKTKTEVVETIKKSGYPELIAHTVSCTHTRQTRKHQPHCGLCSQCVDRRFATLAAGCEADDPADMYAVDLLKGEHAKTEDRTMVESYVRMATELKRMPDATHFLTRFAEASRVLRYMDGRTDQIVQRIFELHQRHAEQVCSVVDRAIGEHASELREGTLPAECLICLVCASDALPAGRVPFSVEHRSLTQEVPGGPRGPRSARPRPVVDEPPSPADAECLLNDVLKALKDETTAAGRLRKPAHTLVEAIERRPDAVAHAW